MITDRGHAALIVDMLALTPRVCLEQWDPTTGEWTPLTEDRSGIEAEPWINDTDTEIVAAWAGYVPDPARPEGPLTLGWRSDAHIVHPGDTSPGNVPIPGVAAIPR